MSSKQKGQGPNKTGGFAKERTVPVAEGSLQSKTPGGGPGPRVNRQGSLGGNLQSANTRSRDAQYGGGSGSSQSGWSARQQAQRMQSRAEEERLGHSRQSGYGGLEQRQKAATLESANTSHGSMQSAASGAHQGANADQSPTDSGSRHRPDGKLDSTR